MVVEVAVYVRRLTEAEFPGSPVALGTLVKQLGEQLGLTIPGMKMHRWRIGGEPGATKTAEKDVAKPARSASRDRFTVVNGGAAS
jgi:hypothetical protein